MADEIKQKLSFDVTEFKAGIADMNRGIRIARNEFTAAAGALGDWRKSYEGIETRIKSLNDVMELQRAKVDALTKEYDDLESTGTASEGALKRLQEQISKANADLGKTEGQLKEATDAQDKFGKETDDTADELVRYGKETDDTSDELHRYGKKADEAGHKTGKFTEFLKKAGSVVKSGVFASAKAVGVAMTTIGAAAGAAAKGIFDLTKKSGVWADDLKTTSEQTGLTVKQLQELEYTSRFVDVEVETMTSSMAKNIKSMKGVQDGTKLSVEAYKKLGVQVLNADGSLRDGQDVYWEAIDALGKVANETERDALAMQLFGRSAQDLNPMIKAGSEVMKAYADEARELGLVMSDEMIDKLGGFDDLMQKTNAQFEGLGRQLAVTFLPGVQAAGTAVSGLLSKISDALSDGFQPEDVKVIGEQIGKVLSDGIASISKYLPAIIDTVADTLGQMIDVVVKLLPTILPALIDGAIDLIDGVLESIEANIQPIADTAVLLVTKFAEFMLKNVPLFFDVAAQLIVAFMQGLADMVPELVPLIGDMVNSMLATISESYPLLIEAGMSIFLSLMTGLIESLPTMIPTIVDMIILIVNTILDNLPAIIAAAIQIIVALIQGLVAALPQLIAWLPTIVDTVIDVILDSLDLLIDAAIEIIIALIGGLVQALPQLIAAAPQIITAIVTGMLQSTGKLIEAVPELFKALWDSFKSMDWLQVGMDVIGGIANGIGSAVGTLIDAARNAARSALDTIKNFLGIASPSKVFQDEVGVNMGLGVAEGISQTSTDISDAMKGVTDKLKGDVQIDKTINVAGVATQASGGSAILQIENFYNNTDKDIEQLAYEFEFARQKAAVALGG